jgi:hypothetical protein
MQLFPPVNPLSAAEAVRQTSLPLLPEAASCILQDHDTISLRKLTLSAVEATWRLVSRLPRSPKKGERIGSHID